MNRAFSKLYFHNNEDPAYADDGVRDLNRARCETRAYCSLKRFGICDGGYVPKFYGYMLTVNPASWAPHLEAFQHDRGLPSVILIEYLPQPLVMDSVTYSKKRMQKAAIGIQQIHLALIEHNDPHPKNILIVPGDPERVVWIDFDVAIGYPNNTYIGDRERRWIEEESLQMIKDQAFLRIQNVIAVANTKRNVTGVCPAGDALDFTVNAFSLVEVLVSDGKSTSGSEPEPLPELLERVTYLERIVKRELGDISLDLATLRSLAEGEDKTALPTPAESPVADVKCSIEPLENNITREGIYKMLSRNED
ncbi:hypothetical protein BDV24DRAFT_169377 [Aspergillus arachidicola]|uniref:Protein kinase domain-containing protein n=1 Tax=Aspergillus arachidicola TaxID=656916 RepID=A0A5N6XPV4_9EURO|nr:hypothetical protein BDV24DRAFT_169377 [Aspergillus arachidicola]